MDPEQLVTIVEFYLEKNKIAGAKEQLKLHQNNYPDSPQVLYAYSLIEHAEGLNQKAYKSIKEALLKEPKNQCFRDHIFKILIDLKMYPEAEQVILELIYDYPADGNYYALYAILMFSSFEIKKAEQLCQEALRLSPEQPLPLLTNALILIFKKRNKQASEILNEVLKSNPESKEVLIMLAGTLEQQGKRYEALEVVQQLIAHFPLDEDLIKIAIELKASNSWIVMPYRPLLKLGLLGSVILWLSFIIFIKFLSWQGLVEWAIPVAIFYVIYCIGSWVLPPILRKYYFVRGI